MDEQRQHERALTAAAVNYVRARRRYVAETNNRRGGRPRAAMTRVVIAYHELMLAASRYEGVRW